jgi:serine/threonine protein kinase
MSAPSALRAFPVCATVEAGVLALPKDYTPKTLAAHRGGVPLPLREALQLLDEIMLGLRRLHERELIHGDIKPSNIYMRSRPGLADPGVSP